MLQPSYKPKNAAYRHLSTSEDCKICPVNFLSRSFSSFENPNLMPSPLVALDFSTTMSFCNRDTSSLSSQYWLSCLLSMATSCLFSNSNTFIWVLLSKYITYAAVYSMQLLSSQVNLLGMRTTVYDEYDCIDGVEVGWPQRSSSPWHIEYYELQQVVVLHWNRVYADCGLLLHKFVVCDAMQNRRLPCSIQTEHDHLQRW